MTRKRRAAARAIRRREEILLGCLVSIAMGPGAFVNYGDRKPWWFRLSGLTFQSFCLDGSNV